LTSDDIAGIQSVWGAPQSDQFNSNGLSNGSYKTPASITSYIDGNGQIAIPNLRITSASQAEWFSVTVPSSTTGTMVVTEQSSNLSMLSPDLWVDKPTSGIPTPIGSVVSTAYGATVSYSVSGVQAGQTYLIKEYGNQAAASTGAFGLEVNFGSLSQAPISPPNTLVLQQPNQGGGVDNSIMRVSKGHSVITIGSLSEPGDFLLMNASSSPITTALVVPSSSTVATQVVTTDAVTPVVAAAPTQPGPPAVKSSVVPAAAVQAGSSSSGSTPTALQAIDATILDWKTTNRLSAFTKGNTTGFSLVR